MGRTIVSKADVAFRADENIAPPSVWCLFWVDEHRNARLSQIFATKEEAERVAVEHPEGLPEAFVQSWAVHQPRAGSTPIRKDV